MNLQNLSDISMEDFARYTQLLEWLNEVITEQDFRVESLLGDASLRRYYRVYLENAQLEETNQEDSDSMQQNPSDVVDTTVYIVMDAPPEKISITEFVQVAELMAKTVNVPDIIARDMDSGFLLLQDFGTVEFAHLLADAEQSQINDYYQQAMQSLAQLQTIDIAHARQQSIPDYDETLLKREMSLFTEWFLPYINVDLIIETEILWDELNTELVAHIEAQPKVLVHRDYHSRNLMQDRSNFIQERNGSNSDSLNDCNSIGIIDFQDAVIGAYSYDLISLLRDAYVRWDEEQISQWKRDFWELLDAELKAGRSFEQFYHDVMVMGVQRHLKILGIFIRLSERDGKNRYLADIPKVMDDVVCELKWLAENGENNIKSVCKNVLLWFNGQVLPAYTVKFGDKA